MLKRAEEMMLRGKKIEDTLDLLKKQIDLYKGKIPEPYYSRLKEAMYNYEVEIND